MMKNEEYIANAWVKQLMKETDREKPSADFTKLVMGRIAFEAIVPEQKRNYLGISLIIYFVLLLTGTLVFSGTIQKIFPTTWNPVDVIKTYASQLISGVLQFVQGLNVSPVLLAICISTAVLISLFALANARTSNE